MNFSNTLSNTDFQYNDVVKLQYQSSDKVIITNFPTSATPTYSPKGTEESFRITRNGLISYTSSKLLPNSIIFNDSLSKKEVAIIKFDRINKKLIVTSTNITAINNYPSIGSVTIPPPQAVFLLRLRDSNNNAIKASSVINGNETASKFQSELNDKNFEFNDILEIYSLKEPSTTINNFPNQNQNSPLTGDNIGDGIRGFFRITQSGLQQYIPTTEPSFSKLQTDLIIRDDNGNTIGSILFDNDEKIFYITGFNTTSSINLNFLLDIGISDQSSNLIANTSLSGSNSISTFIKAINFIKFDIGYFIRINRLNSPLNANTLIVTNYTSFDPLHRVKDGERFEITAQGLVNPNNANPNPNPTLQQILIGTSQIISKIQFDITNKKIIVDSIGFITQKLFSPTVIFLTKLRDSLGQNIKTSALIKDGENANNFRNALNNTDFELGDILDLEAYFADDNSITNFPTTGQFHRIGSGLLTGENVHEFFKITAQGLQSYTPPNTLPIQKLPNEVIIKRSDGTIFITISFNTEDKIITCSNASGEYSNTGQSVNLFTFQLANTQSNFATISTLQSRDEAFVFAQNIRLKFFEYDDVLVLKYTDASRQFINITNIQGQTYTPTSNIEVFDIKPTGLIKR